MLIKLTGGKVYDPTHGIDGAVHDIYVRDGRVVADPGPASIDQQYDLRGKVVMAGGIDLHTHIGGGKINIGRTMLPEDHRRYPADHTDLTRSGCGHASPSSFVTGYRYAQMGYTTCFEPAMVPVNARQTHMELADTPMIDKGTYVMLGSDDFLLRLLTAGADQKAINDYVAWTLHATQSIAVKVINPGGISAFKFNQRKLDLDEPNAYYGVTPREVLRRLTRAVVELGVPHPVHLHGCNLGVPGNVDTTLSTVAGVEGLPLHLTHVQFHSYGNEGDFKFSSGSARIAEAVNHNRNITVDVGQVMFGQTVTASGDTMTQYRNHHLASPHKWMCMDIECEAGCGVVPFRYRDRNFVNALQWLIGLELFLLIQDPWRVFLTVDHPNGAAFTTYPHLIRLLMDRSFRNDMLATINANAAAMSTLGSIDREYSLYEIAILTRAGPARILGLTDRGHLGPNAIADITVYTERANKEEMFARPDYVFKNGELVVRDGVINKVVWGATQVVRPEYDPAIEKSLHEYFERYHTMRLEHFKVQEEEIVGDGRGRVQVHPCSVEKRI